MIKNLLYSLFIHFFLIAAIYLSFSRHNHDFVKSNETSVSIALLNQDNLSANKDVISSNLVNQDLAKEISKEKIEETLSKAVKSEEIPEITKKSSSSEVGKENINTSKDQKLLDQRRLSDALKKDEAKKNLEETSAKLPLNTLDYKQLKKVPEERKQTSQQAKTEISKSLKHASQNLSPDKSISSISEGNELSSRERLNIQLQIKSCYKRAVQESRLDSKIKLFIKIAISQEGYIETEMEEITDLEKYNDPNQKDYKIVIDNIRRSLELCSPLRNLPPDKYEIWKEIVLQFDPVFNE